MRFGVPPRFAIDSEVESASHLSGRLRLWIGGHQLGQYDYFQNLDEALEVLSRTEPVQVTTDPQFADLTSLQILDLMYRADVGVSQRRQKYLICPNLGTAFDGLYVTRIIYAGHEELLWREFEERVAHCMSLDLGEYAAIVKEFGIWIDQFRTK